MNSETMTVHMLLTELKTIEKRIDKAIKSITPIGTKEHIAKKVNGIEINEFNEQAKSAEQSALDLIARQNAMRSALYKYNTETEIEVNGQKMTIAHALWLMKHGMDEKDALLKHYETAYAKAVKDVEKANGEALNEAATRAADSACGGKEGSKSEEYLDMIVKYKENHAKEYVDPLNLKKRIEDLSEQIEKFAAEVDARIQTANATNNVTIEY